MPNKATHVRAGMISGGAVATLQARDLSGAALLAEVLGGILGGYCGGRLPDVIEPPTSPRHRQTAHSWTIGIGTAFSALQILPQWQCSIRDFGKERSPEIQFLCHVAAGTLMGVAVGYVSHLALDSVTPSGLPNL